MKVIFYLIKVNELWHCTPECGCKSPASASSCYCLFRGLSAGIAVLWNPVLFGYDSSQSATRSNSLFSLNQLQVRFEWLNYGRVPIVLFLPSDLRGQS